MPEIHLHGFGEDSSLLSKRISELLCSQAYKLSREIVFVIHNDVVITCCGNPPRTAPYIQICGTNYAEMTAVAHLLKEDPECPDLEIGPLLLGFFAKGGRIDPDWKATP
jgi:hypothetical protein